MASAAESGNLDVGAALLTAHRAHVAALALGREDDPSEEAEAGALLEASDAHDARVHRANVEAMFKALANMQSG